MISPGLVLHHMLPSELALLVRPVVAYGLIDTAADALATLAVADGIVIRPEVATGIAESEALLRGAGSYTRLKPFRCLLTTVLQRNRTRVPYLAGP